MAFQNDLEGDLHGSRVIFHRRQGYGNSKATKYVPTSPAQKVKMNLVIRCAGEISVLPTIRSTDDVGEPFWRAIMGFGRCTEFTWIHVGVIEFSSGWRTTIF